MTTRAWAGSATRIHPVALGCMNLAGAYGPTDENEARSLLARTFELGVNFWDTANVYGDGVSESRLGAFFAEDRARREKIVLATKFSIRRMPDGRRVIDNSPEHMRESLEGSLKRLGVDHVDLYYAHRVDPNTPVEETVEAMAREVRAGKIGAIGLSEISPDTLRRAHTVHPIAAVQSEYSLWTRTPEVGLIQTCRELGVSFVAFSPVARGLFGGDLQDVESFAPRDFRSGLPRFNGLNWKRNREWAGKFIALAKSWNWNPAALSIAWVLAKGDHIIALPGMRSAKHLEEDASGADRALTPDEVAEIERVLPIGFAAGDRYSDAQWGAAQRYA